jgi:hypothetical protein
MKAIRRYFRSLFKAPAVVALFGCVLLSIHAQNAAKPTLPDGTLSAQQNTVTETSVPAVPDATKVQLLKAQHEKDTLTANLSETITRANAFIAQQNKLIEAKQAEIDTAKAKALADANLDPKLWSVDLDGPKFVKIPVATTEKPEAVKK